MRWCLQTCNPLRQGIVSSASLEPRRWPEIRTHVFLEPGEPWLFPLGGRGTGCRFDHRATGKTGAPDSGAARACAIAAGGLKTPLRSLRGAPAARAGAGPALYGSCAGTNSAGPLDGGRGPTSPRATVTPARDHPVRVGGLSAQNVRGPQSRQSQPNS